MRIAVLTGGTSSEREVALASSENVIQALKKNYEVTVFDFPKDLDKFFTKTDRVDRIFNEILAWENE